MSTVREFLTDHAHVLGTAGAVLLLGWVLLRLVAEALVPALAVVAAAALCRGGETR